MLKAHGRREAGRLGLGLGAKNAANWILLHLITEIGSDLYRVVGDVFRTGYFLSFCLQVLSCLLVFLSFFLFIFFFSAAALEGCNQLKNLQKDEPRGRDLCTELPRTESTRGSVVPWRPGYAGAHRGGTASQPGGPFLMSSRK